MKKNTIQKCKENFTKFFNEGILDFYNEEFTHFISQLDGEQFCVSLSAEGIYFLLSKPNISCAERTAFVSAPLSVYKIPLPLDGCYITGFLGPINRCEAPWIEGTFCDSVVNMSCVFVLVDSHTKEVCGVRPVFFNPEIVEFLLENFKNSSRYDQGTFHSVVDRFFENTDDDELWENAVLVGKERGRFYCNLS